MRDTDLYRKLRRAFQVPALRGSLQKRHARRERWLRERGVALPAGQEATNDAGCFYLRTLRYGGDTMHGGDGLDTLFGDDGNDMMFGDADRDEMFGVEGDDEMHGGGGNDGTTRPPQSQDTIEFSCGV